MKRPLFTREQRLFVYHQNEAFLRACPGSGKTRAIVGRVWQLGKKLPRRKGLAVLSFTNTAVDEFQSRSNACELNHLLKFPNYVGTFDAFVRHFLVLPTGIPFHNTTLKPAIVDSWNTLGIEVRLRNPKNFAGRGVPLDYFDAEDNTIDLDRIGIIALRNHVRDHKSDYEDEAKSYRSGLMKKGHLSTADARVQAVRNLNDTAWADSLGRALAARFDEVIVDEAQDCNPLDLKILEWLRQHGLRVTVVCDPDQAIYSFRQSKDHTDILANFAANYSASDRLALTGNFRSSSHICAAAATFRSSAKPDSALGTTCDAKNPIQILVYPGAKVPSTVGTQFMKIASGAEISSEQSIVLAHKRRIALAAAGRPANANVGGDGRVARFARAVSSFSGSTGSDKARERALRSVEKMILQMMGAIEDREAVSSAINRQDINSRWLRRCAYVLITDVPKSCEDTDAARSAWVDALHQAVRKLDLSYKNGTKETTFFVKSGKTWNQLLQQPILPTLQCATVHEAKGREYAAVCLVIPPDQSPLNQTEALFAAWEGRNNDEAKRVCYVGVTRAMELAAIAVPSAYKERLMAILNAANVSTRPYTLSNS